MKKIGFKFKLKRFKLNKRGLILLVVALVSISTVATVLIVGALKSNRNKEPGTISEATDITPEPTQAPELIEDETGNEEEIPTPSPSPVPAAAPFVFPKEDIRPVAVAIDNEGGKVLPQGGIGQAQIVYEVITEYGLTRYLALFWDNLPPMIGPVRSLRHYFLDYIMEYNAILTHVGWSHYAYHDLERFEIDHIDGVTPEAGAVFWDLTREKDNYHDTYTSPERLMKFIEDNELITENEGTLPLSYHAEDKDLENTKSARDVFIKYNVNSNCGYYYDSSTKNYKRTRQGQFQIDRNTDEVIRVKNIIILYVENEPISGDTVGRQELHTTGSGNGYYITNGAAEEITWRKSSRTTKTEYRNAKGDKINLNPGQTWIQIVPLNAEVTIQ